MTHKNKNLHLLAEREIGPQNHENKIRLDDTHEITKPLWGCYSHSAFTQTASVSRQVTTTTRVPIS